MKRNYLKLLMLFFGVFLYGNVSAQAGSTCATPLNVATLPFSDAGMTTAGFGDNYSTSPCGNSYIGGDEKIYTYTPAANEIVDVTLENLTNAWTGIMILDDCPDVATTCVGSATSSSGTANLAATNLALTAGTTYYFVVSTYPTPQTTGGDFTIELSPVCGDMACTGTETWQTCPGDCPTPLGANCANPLNVSSLPYADAGMTTLGFGDIYSSSLCNNYMTGDEKVYTYTPAANETVDVTLENITNTYSGISILDDCPDVATTCIGSAVTTGTSNLAATNLALTAGTTYYFVVSTNAAPQTTGGDFTIELSPVCGDLVCSGTETWQTCPGDCPTPLGANCANPLNVSSLPYADAGMTTAGFGDIYSSTLCNTYMSGDEKVYTYTPAANETVDVTLENITNTYSGISILDDCPDVATTCIGSAVTTGTSNLAATNLALTAGTTYYFVVSTWASPQTTGGDFAISLSPTCIPPTALNASSITATSATLNWIAPVSGTTPVDYNWEVQPAGTAQGTAGAIASGTGASSGVSTGATLSATTSYDFFVQSNCGGTSTWAGPVSFTTAIPITCGTPVNTTHCYNASDAQTWHFVGSSSDPLRIEFNSGTMESCCDDIIIYDGADASAPVLYYDNNSGDLTGLVVTATGNELFVAFDSDGSIQCSTSGGSYDNIDFDVYCLPCTPPTATFTTVPDCANNQYSVDVNVTDMGDATSYDIDLGGTSQGTVSGISTVTVGPYSNGSVNNFTLIHNVDITCNLTETGVTYNCPPANDECAGATALTVNTDLNCGSFASGTLASATASSETETCAGTFDNDVWYSFTATATQHEIQVSNIVGSSTDMVYQLTDGCGGAQLFCHDTPNSGFSATGLTIGNSYLIRVDTYNGTAANTTFDICVGTLPPPPANDECSGATSLTVNADLNCGSFASGTLTSATASSEAETCAGTFDNDVWYSFTATATQHEIQVSNIVGSSTDMVYQLTDGCGGAQLFCHDTPNSGFSATGLTIGNSYLIRVDTYNGTAANTTFDICVGTLPPPPANDDCATATVLACGSSLTGETNASASDNGDATGCSMGIGVWYTFVGTGESVTVSSFADFDHELSVSSSSDCVVFSNVGCSDIALSNGTESVSFVSSLGTVYYFYVGHYGSATSGIFDISVNCVPAGAVTWTGGTNTDFNTASNWSNSLVPTCVTDIYIPSGTPNNLEVTGAFECNNFTTATNVGANVTLTGSLGICGDVVLANSTNITGPGAMILNGTTLGGSGTSFSVTGSATVSTLELKDDYSFVGNLDVDSSIVLDGGNLNASAATITLKSTATGTAYLDDFTNPGNTYSGNLTVERFVTTGSGLGQRYFGSPVNGGVINGLDATYAGGIGQLQADQCGVLLAVGSPYSNMLEWHQDATFASNTCTDDGWFAIAASDVMTNGRGYSGWMNDGSIISVTGIPNTGNIVYSATADNLAGTTPLNASRWHLLSNPYPSTLNADAAISSGFTSPQTHDASTGAFAGTFNSVLASGNELASMQGFFAEHTTGSLDFEPTNIDRIASATTAWQSSSTLMAHKLEVVVYGNGFADKTYIVYSDDNNVTNNFDDYTDCKKRNSNIGQPTIYSDLNGTRMSFNSRTIESFGETIPLGVQHDADGSFELSFTGVNTLPSNATIYVHDKQLDVYQNIENGNYAYTALETDNSDRFELVFVLPIEVAVTNVDCQGNEGNISLVSTTGITNRNYELVNSTTIISTADLSNLNVDVNTGNYILTVSDAFGGNQVYNVEVEAAEAIVADMNISSLNVEVGEFVNFDNLTVNATDVEWTINDATINGVNNATYSFEEEGTYPVMLSVSNDDCQDTKTVMVEVTNKTTSIIDVDGSQSIKVYSVGTELVLEFINANSSNATISVESVIGQRVYNGLVSTDNIQRVNITNVTSGYYFVNISMEGSNVSTKVLLTK